MTQLIANIGTNLPSGVTLPIGTSIVPLAPETSMVLTPGITLPDDLTVSIAINIYGDASDNSLRGNSSNNNIYGRGGNDVIFGEGGRDFLYGEDGNDLLFAGKGDEFGNGDNLNGGDGNDILSGGMAHDGMHGGNGADSLYGGEGDWLYGGNGNDRFILGPTVNGTQIHDLEQGDLIQLPGGIIVSQGNLVQERGSGLFLVPLVIGGYKIDPVSWGNFGMHVIFSQVA
jgi:Ca2+-binding RTX toxin-like protein